MVFATRGAVQVCAPGTRSPILLDRYRACYRSPTETLRLNWLKFQTGAGSSGGTADGGTGGRIVLTGTGGSAGDGVGGSPGAGGSTGVTGGRAGSGCACDTGNDGWPSGALALAGLLAALLGGRRRRP